jgi:hypothetical protein
MKILDVCSGVGGAAAGYMDRGHYVVGVDIEDQPEYIGDEFIQSEGVGFVQKYGHQFDFIHASWPCQGYSALTKGTNQGNGKKYPKLIAPGRRAMQLTGKPWIIENVAGAEIRKDLMLCGEMFNLAVIRHRYFELSELIKPWKVRHKPHRGYVAGWRHGEWHEGPYFAVYGEGGGKGSVKEWRQAMGIDWTWNRKSIAEAIPPAYTRHIARIIEKRLHEER